MKKKKEKDIFVFSKRLKLNYYHKNLINYLTRNSKAVYNTSVYYTKKLLNKDKIFLVEYNKIISKYKNIPTNCLSVNGLCMYISNCYNNYKYMANMISQQTIKREYNGFISYFILR